MMASRSEPIGTERLRIHLQSVAEPLAGPDRGERVEPARTVRRGEKAVHKTAERALRTPAGNGNLQLGGMRRLDHLPPASRNAFCRVSSSDDDMHMYTAPLVTVRMLTHAL